jgi:hypothetical protein
MKSRGRISTPKRSKERISGVDGEHLARLHEKEEGRAEEGEPLFSGPNLNQACHVTFHGMPFQRR